MAKKPQTSKTVSLTKASPAKVKKVTKPAKVQKAPAIKSVKAKPVKKTASKVVKVPKKGPKKIKAAKLSQLTTAKAPKPPRAPKKAANSSGPKGYTADQYQQFLVEQKKMAGKSNQELKDMLRKNFQSMSGNKDELVDKVADGVVLGRIPRCPKCFGGRPKFDFKKGTYYCSGYRDDEDFKNCHSTFELNEIKRDPWE